MQCHQKPQWCYVSLLTLLNFYRTIKTNTAVNMHMTWMKYECLTCILAYTVVYSNLEFRFANLLFSVTLWCHIPFFHKTQGTLPALPGNTGLTYVELRLKSKDTEISTYVKHDKQNGQKRKHFVLVWKQFADENVYAYTNLICAPFSRLLRHWILFNKILYTGRLPCRMITKNSYYPSLTSTVCCVVILKWNIIIIFQAS